MNNSDLAYSWEERFERYCKIRLSIFFICAVCVGLPCLIWAFYSVHRLRKAKGGISAFIILLLLTDLLQLILYPRIVTDMPNPSEKMYVIVVVTGCLKLYSLQLHQLVALEGVLTVKYPTISAGMFSSSCYIIISFITLLIPAIAIGLICSGEYVKLGGLFVLGSNLAPLILLVVKVIIICKAPPTAASTPVNHRPGAKVFTVSLITLLVLYLPFMLFLFTPLIIPFNDTLKPYFLMVLCLLSLTVIPEPLLCVLVCRENLNAQGNRTQIEISAEETSV